MILFELYLFGYRNNFITKYFIISILNTVMKMHFMTIADRTKEKMKMYIKEHRVPIEEFSFFVAPDSRNTYSFVLHFDEKEPIKVDYRVYCSGYDLKFYCEEIEFVKNGNLVENNENILNIIRDRTMKFLYKEMENIISQTIKSLYYKDVNIPLSLLNGYFVNIRRIRKEIKKIAITNYFIVGMAIYASIEEREILIPGVYRSSLGYYSSSLIYKTLMGIHRAYLKKMLSLQETQKALGVVKKALTIDEEYKINTLLSAKNIGDLYMLIENIERIVHGKTPFIEVKGGNNCA